MSQNPVRYTAESLGALIFTIRKQRVILDADLASIYGVQTKRLNEQVRRNSERFPGDFMFQLTLQEVTDLKSQIATSSSADIRSQIATASKRNIRFMPYVFTEHGAIMAANVLEQSRGHPDECLCGEGIHQNA